MSEEEFDLLDELYFVQPFSYLQESTSWEDELILKTLQSLYQKGYIKCLSAPDEERFDKVDVMKEGSELLYLATKEGLMAHNAL
ncbi:MAG TPA: hypothetical protein DEQ87_18325 [Algoriphagus sp.]|jgi:hypothetical protein|uniref:hypothetical protein n=1 Tax=unclassified Algoriphagus TaxID=2641541 RepID=UPI000C4B9370|nr:MULTISPECIES: hypothetical protein [unclassified Algoriphagus]MAL15087.1 hypothetical protein [Algoriphagus sp.]MAN87849.1 hypothetical protein [Algoriphagus sp.]HAD52198.1 hypothetical protein [Algoriphagus sp.]HAH36827.1 hypothetical protein [Algoriphagus sp.]HAZ25185.1 hypothetical protein [Algoriphagus sp.]|tara:strand:- start:254 stop:505 length:252 start_codon:yes stop_codon:yes gene_type:complete